MQLNNYRRRRLLRQAFIVILSLALIAPVLMAKERKGAQLVITTRYGKILQGELLAVKGENLILMDGSTSEGITENISDILTIKIVKKSKLLKGLGTGFLAGAGCGALVGIITGKENPGLIEWTPGQGAAVGVIAFGTLGALIGGMAAGMSGIYQNIIIKNTSPQEITRVIIRLRKLARERG